MKKAIIIFSVLFFSISLSAQSFSWQNNIKRLENKIKENEEMTRIKKERIIRLSSDTVFATDVQEREIFFLNKEVDQLSSENKAFKSIIKTYQKLIEKEEEDKLLFEKKAKETKEAKEKEAEEEKIRKEREKNREDEIKRFVRERINACIQQSEANQKESN